MKGPPTPKASQKQSGKCGHHPRYTGANPPRAACPVCWGVYLKKKYGMEPRSVHAPVVIQVSDAMEIQSFITGLKNAVVRSQESGGLYSAFIHDVNGGVTQVEIHLKRGTR